YVQYLRHTVVVQKHDGDVRADVDDGVQLAAGTRVDRDRAEDGQRVPVGADDGQPGAVDALSDLAGGVRTYRVHEDLQLRAVVAFDLLDHGEGQCVLVQRQVRVLRDDDLRQRLGDVLGPHQRHDQLLHEDR